MKRFLLILTLLIIPFSLLSSDYDLSKHEYTSQDIIVSMSPTPAQNNVASNVIIKAVFNVGLDPEHVKKNDITLKCIFPKNEFIEGEVSYLSDEKTILLEPVEVLSEGVYELTYSSLKALKEDKEYQIKEIKYRFKVIKQLDTNPPVITLNGDNPLIITKGEIYFESGATAIDDKDGNIPVIITGSVDSSTVGTYILTYSAVDATGNEASIARSIEVIQDVVSTLESLEIQSTSNTLRIGQSINFKLTGNYSDGTTVDFTSQADYHITNTQVASIYGSELKALAEGNTTIHATIGNITSNSILFTVHKELDTSNFSLIDFGTTYIDMISADATKVKYDEKLFCMITGKIISEDGSPLSGVKITIHNHNEYGSQQTDSNGKYTFASEGDTYLTMRYTKEGYSTIDRKIYAPAKEWSIAPDVTMLKVDDKVTPIQLGTSTPLIHVSTPVNDDRGERSTTLIFDGITKATVTSVDGSIRELTNIAVRATEFKTPASMPADLPKESAYTYCSDLKVDGIGDDENIIFDAPVIMYVDNFLGFDIGEIVPIGYYDRNEARWIGSKNGVVIQLLDTDGDGKVDSLDSDGDNLPNDLDNDGLFVDEVAGIMDNVNYVAGKSYWRAEITHFTPWDHNWPYGPPEDAANPDNPDIGDSEPLGDCSEYINSYVTAKTRVFHEDIPISGSDITLHYSSKRVDGYTHVIDASVDTTNFPSSVIGVTVKLEVAGQVFTQNPTVDELNDLQFRWDGKDIIGNKLSGDVNAKLSIAYRYNTVYYSASSQFSEAWANVGSSATAIRGRNTVDLWTDKEIEINTEVINRSNFIANGWSIEDNKYLRLFDKGFLQGIAGKKYIEIKNGLLFAVEEKPKNRLNYFPVLKDQYFALTLKYPSANLGYSGNKVSLSGFSFIEGKISNVASTVLGSYSNFDFSLSYANRPINGYDAYAFHRGTIYEGISDRNYLEPSNSMAKMKESIKEKINTNTPYKIATNTSNGDINRDNNYWTIFQPDQALLNKLNEYYNLDTVTNLSTNSEYQNIGLREDNIVVFEGDLGYVFDIYTGLLEKVFDNTNKTILMQYTHDAEHSISTIIDQFNNTISITRDVNGNPTLITAPNGQKTHLNVDNNGDLLSVGYEDGSAYNFEYDSGSLMTGETDPNANAFLHLFDLNGKISKEIDAIGGEWSFMKDGNGKIATYTMIKPEGDESSSIDTIQSDGSTVSQRKLPNGDTFLTTISEDKNQIETTKDGVITKSIYTVDIFNQQQIPLSKETIQPSGLSNITSYETSYDGNQTHTNSKTQTVNANGKTTTIISDYNSATKTITTPESRVATELYDKATLLTTSISSGSLTPTTYTYDTKGRVTKIITGTRETTYTYDAKGNIATMTDPKANVTNYEYNIMDRLTKVTYPNGTIEQYEYDFNNNMTKLVTPTPTNHTFTYNGVDKQTNYTSPLNKATAYNYNKNRKVTSIVRPSGKTISNNYINDRLASITTPEGTRDYTYLFADKIGTISNAGESLIYLYDGELLTSQQQSGILNQTINYNYNNDFAVASTVYAGITTAYTYDNDGLLTQSGNYTITRDAENGFSTKVTDNTLTKNITYNDYGEIVSSSDNIFSYNLSQRDNSGAITQKKETIDAIETTYDYSYDTRGRLTSVSKNNIEVENYTYDNNGNRLQATVKGATTSASYTLDDNLEVYGNNTYMYDADGYLVEKTTPSETTNYMYNTLGALTSVTTPTKTITYRLNALKQRVAKEVDGVITEKYLWANLTTLLAVYDGSDNLVQRFNYADNRMPISMTQDNQTYYLHYDQVGTLRAVTDSSNNIIKEITYDTFGNILSDTDEEFKVPFGFAGGLHDRDTDLVHFGYREYDALTGKWTAKDPIGFDGGDSNLYGYVLGDPVEFVDPSGLEGLNFDFSPFSGMPMNTDLEFFNWLKNYTKGLYGTAAAVSTAGGMCMVAPPLYYWGMRNPEMSYAGLELMNDLINDSMPASNPLIQGAKGAQSLWNLIND